MKTIVTVTLLMATLSVLGQNAPVRKGVFSGTQQSAKPVVFPQSFAGKWKGSLTWYVAGKKPQQFTMRLNIQLTDTPNVYTWQIIYGDKEQDNRPYLLKPVDTAKGHWVVDERDGILLDSYVHGNSLHGAFTVSGNTIIDNYALVNDKMEVEFFTVKLEEKSRSGKGTEDVPWVDSYRVAGYQKGVLERVK